MCSPVAFLALQGGMEAAQVITQHIAQQKAYEANKKSAIDAYNNISNSLSVRQMQEMVAAGQSIESIDRQARHAHAIAAVSAGESGVSGASVEALLDIMEKDRATAVANTRANLDTTIASIQDQKTSAESQKESRIASVPKPDWAVDALKIVGVGADVGAGYMKMNP